MPRNSPTTRNTENTEVCSVCEVPQKCPLTTEKELSLIQCEDLGLSIENY